MHSKNLAKFVFLYKSMMVILQRMEGKEQHFHSFIAGVIGGYLVFGENNKINSQVGSPIRPTLPSKIVIRRNYSIKDM